MTIQNSCKKLAHNRIEKFKKKSDKLFKMFAIYSFYSNGNATMQSSLFLKGSMALSMSPVTLWVISPALNNSFFEMLKVSNLHTVDHGFKL